MLQLKKPTKTEEEPSEVQPEKGGAAEPDLGEIPATGQLFLLRGGREPRITAMGQAGPILTLAAQPKRAPALREGPSPSNRAQEV